jgi:hypothetical protein
MNGRRRGDGPCMNSHGGFLQRGLGFSIVACDRWNTSATDTIGLEVALMLLPIEERKKHYIRGYWYVLDA